MKIFEALRHDHDKQRGLIKLINETSGDCNTRQVFFEQLKKELSQHAVAEERAFYAPLMNEDSTIKMSRHGIAEHHQIDKFIEKLDQTEMSSPAWLVTFKKLADVISHHLDEEEKQFFDKASDTLSEKQKTDLAMQYQEEMGA